MFDRTSAADLNALYTELTTDPESLGYAPHVTANDYNMLAFLIQDPRTYTTPIDVAFITGEEAQCAVVGTEWDALGTNEATRHKLTMWQTLVSLQAIEVRHPNMRGQFLEIWGPGTQTRTNLGALQTTDGNRAEELYGHESTISADDCRTALQGGGTLQDPVSKRAR